MEQSVCVRVCVCETDRKRDRRERMRVTSMLTLKCDSVVFTSACLAFASFCVIFFFLFASLLLYFPLLSLFLLTFAFVNTVVLLLRKFKHHITGLFGKGPRGCVKSLAFAPTPLYDCSN